MISVTILTKNSEGTLQEVLESLKSFDEVLVADTGSKDNTETVAKSFKNVRFISIPFEGFGKSHNAASDIAKHDWILSVDSDEVMTPTLLKEIESLSLNPDFAYSMPRENHYKGTIVKSCGWYPDRVVRLYNKKRTQFSNRMVHEAVELTNVREKKLNHPLKHTPYRSVADFLDKMQRYSDLFVEQNRGKKRANRFTAFFHGLYGFFKSYILQKGILQGGVGFEISFYNGATAFYKYLKLTETCQGRGP